MTASRAGGRRGRLANDAHGSEGNALTVSRKLVLQEAPRVSHLAEDIESHRPVQMIGEPSAEERCQQREDVQHG